MVHLDAHSHSFAVPTYVVNVSAVGKVENDTTWCVSYKDIMVVYPTLCY